MNSRYSYSPEGPGFTLSTPLEDPEREAAFEDWRTAPGGERG